MKPTWLLLLTGAAFGFGAWEAGIRLLPEADPARWTLGGASVPVEMAELGGALRPRPGALDLSFYRVAAPRLAPFADGVVELVAHVPADGQLFVRLGADAVTGPMKPIQGGAPGAAPGGGKPGDPPPRGPEGAARSGTAPGAGPALAGPPLGGGPGGPPPGGGPGGPPPGGGPGASPASLARQRGVGLLVDRSAAGGLRGVKLDCADAPAPINDRFALRVEARGGEIAVSVDGKPATTCRGRWGPGALVLGSGVRRVQVDSVDVTAGTTRLHETFDHPLHHLLVGVLATLAGAAAGLGAASILARRAPARVRAVALASLPLLGVPLLGRVDLRGVLDALRLLDLAEAWAPLLFAGVPALAALLLVAGAAAPTLRRAALVGLAPLALAALAAAGAAVAGTLTSSFAGLAVLGALGVPWAALAWINTHPVRRRVAASYGLVAVLFVGAEGGLRLTNLDEAWTRTAGWKRASEEFAELLEIRRYRSYPDEGFPVRPPDPDPTKRRIVALGGSSTGGAFQMDDLDQFWPRRLGESLAGTDWEVVNQGVGGWNTLHVRLYVESQVERLDADVLVLYVGHNDILTPAPVPYSQLYARWRAPDATLTAVSGALNDLRLYVGLKHALFALRGTGSGVAVPVADARANLAAVIATAKTHDARVLLVNEGLNPDPLPMRAYGAMLAALAGETGSAFLDAAEAFRKTGDPELFLDDCHLSVEGHTTLAGWVRDTLEREGWLR